MQIVIDIHENFYNGVKVVTKESEDITEEVVTLPMECIANDTPLPKGHGDLIDIGRAYEALEYLCKKWHWAYGGEDKGTSSYELAHVFDELPTIIEADKAEDM